MLNIQEAFINQAEMTFLSVLPWILISKLFH